MRSTESQLISKLKGDNEFKREVEVKIGENKGSDANEIY
jgi:hypothetical protein